jgi:fructokinase
MSNKPYLSDMHPRPVVAGVGLIALDLLLKDSEVQSQSMWAGGSCGNVLIILSFLGWDSFPVAHFAMDVNSSFLIRDLKRWKVHDDFIFRDIRGSTPIVIERLHDDTSAPFHEFEFTCPNCGSRLPRLKRVELPFCKRITRDVPQTQVFYFDRASKSAVELAKQVRKGGGLVVFEPHRLGTDSTFRESIRSAHIVKYSYEQVNGKEVARNAILEIQTFGAEGLRYRLRRKNRRSSGWIRLPAYREEPIVDTAGAGDWCTAGLLDKIGRKGLIGLEKASNGRVRDALMFGQALGALCCKFDGARGLMYNMGAEEMRKLAARLKEGERLEERPGSGNHFVHGSRTYQCPLCKPSQIRPVREPLAKDPGIKVQKLR